MVRGRKSKYDPILDSFLDSKENIAEVESDVNVDVLRTSLTKRIATRELAINLSTVGGVITLERKNPLMPREEVRENIETIIELLSSTLKREWK